MAVRSVYTPDVAEQIRDGEIVVDGDEHKHLSVSRVRVGEAVEVFNGIGGVWAGVVVDASRNQTRIRLGEKHVVPSRPTEIILAQALVRGSAFDWILEKAVEIGVSRIIPFRAERSNEIGSGRERRWQRIVLEATKQSKQYHVPKLDSVAAFDEILPLPASSRVVLCERGGGRLRTALSGSPVLCMIGPEGGWTDTEIRRMSAAEFHQVHLGDQILRSETAAIVAVGLVAYELGVL